MRRKNPKPKKFVRSLSPPSALKRRKLNYVETWNENVPKTEPLFPTIVEWESILSSYPDEFGWVMLVKENWSAIRTFHREGKLTNTHNLRLQSTAIDISEISTFLEAICGQIKNQFKLQLGFGCVLRNIEDDELKWWFPTPNSKFGYFSEPQLVDSKAKIAELTDKIAGDDIEAFLCLGRESTKFKLEAVVSMQVVCYTMGYAIPMLGCGDVVIPDYILNSTSVRCLLRDSNARFEPGWCVIRGIAFVKNKHSMIGLRKLTNGLKQEFLSFLKKHDVQLCSKNGCLSMDELLYVEQALHVKIFAYRLTRENGGELYAQLIRASPFKSGALINFDMSGEPVDDHVHASPIVRFHSYAKMYKCQFCEQIMKKKCNYTAHLRRNTCASNESKPKYVGGCFHGKQTIFEMMEQEGYEVNEASKYITDFSTWDLEALTICNGENGNSDKKLTFESTLEVLSCSVSSTLLNNEDRSVFLCRSSSENELVERLVGVFVKLSELFQAKRRHELNYLYEQIEIKRNTYEQLRLENQHDPDLNTYYDFKLKELTKFTLELDRNTETHAIYGFNSGCFDVYLIRDLLICELFSRGINITGVLKRKDNNQYSMIRCRNFILLDARNLVGPNLSLKALLETFKLPTQKSCFPYEWCTSVEKLNQKDFVEFEDFFSHLTGKYLISEDEYIELSKTYEQKGFKTMKDFLEFYNKLDTIGLLDAVSMLQRFWTSQGICLASQGISLPSLAQKLMFKLMDKSGCDFLWLPSSSRDGDLIKTADEGRVGGASIIFNRFMCKDKTYINNSANVCKKILGLDANALYLHCLRELLCGLPFRWEFCKDDGYFHRTPMLPKGVSFYEVECMLYFQFLLSKHCTDPAAVLRHYYSPGGQVKPGPRKFTLDGCIIKYKICYEFAGCVIHGHDCYYTRNVPTDELNKRREQFLSKLCYLEKLGYKCSVIWECCHRRLRRTDNQLQQFIKKCCLLPRVRWGNRLTEEQMLEKIKLGQLEGLGKFSAVVPDELRDKFDGFPPIYQKGLISKDEIGEYMRILAESSNDCMRNGRTALVSSFSGQNLTLYSEMVHWFLQNGIKVCVHKFFEFQNRPLFQNVVNTVTTYRRKGDLDPGAKALADLWKLAGNSMFGKFLQNNAKFTSTKFCDVISAQALIRGRFFMGLEEIGGGKYFQVETRKRNFYETTQKICGSQILAKAKVYMHSFFSFLQDCIEKDKMQLCLNDTDSLYMALAGESIEKLVKREKWDYFQRERSKWFVSPELPETIREPGKFKVEFEGVGLIALNSKTYCAFTIDDDGLINGFELIFTDSELTDDEREAKLASLEQLKNREKVVAKGVQKRRNELTIAHYLQVLIDQKTVLVTNTGFRFNKTINKIQRYKLVKTGLNYIYVKRIVAADGRTTTTLTDPVWEHPLVP